jgi:hypothetical protein
LSARALPPPPDGSVLVRVRASGPGWIDRLPAVPADRVLTVTVGHPSLLPVTVDDLVAAGYRIVGTPDPERSFGTCVDVFVPASLREEHPVWWRRLADVADRVFDLRMGPVRAVLGEEIELHLAASG